MLPLRDEKYENVKIKIFSSGKLSLNDHTEG